MSGIDYPRFEFDSDLTRAIIELERARPNLNRGTTPPSTYLQLKTLFQLLTSIMSARIEGNRTSILDAVVGAARPSGEKHRDEGVQEIMNIHAAMDYIEEHARARELDHIFVRNLHSIVVDGLTREGDSSPGAYRLGEVRIGGSRHRPPWPADVFNRMTELFEFIAEPVEPQKQLLQVAIAHHRFLWIHPFGNGNGRVARLLTYGMLVRQGFTSAADYRAVNPTAVFGADRQGYYANLEGADSLSNDGVVEWCTFVLKGLSADLHNLERLSDAQFVTVQLLLPAIQRARAGGDITQNEAQALSTVAELVTVRASDLEPAFPGSPSSRSQAIRKLLDRNLLAPTREGARSYHLVFAPNDLTTHIVKRLDALGMLPAILKEP